MGFRTSHWGNYLQRRKTRFYSLPRDNPSLSIPLSVYLKRIEKKNAVPLKKTTNTVIHNSVKASKRVRRTEVELLEEQSQRFAAWKKY